MDEIIINTIYYIYYNWNDSDRGMENIFFLILLLEELRFII